MEIQLPPSEPLIPTGLSAETLKEWLLTTLMPIYTTPHPWIYPTDTACKYALFRCFWHPHQPQLLLNGLSLRSHHYCNRHLLGQTRLHCCHHRLWFLSTHQKSLYPISHHLHGCLQRLDYGVQQRPQPKRSLLVHHWPANVNNINNIELDMDPEGAIGLSFIFICTLRCLAGLIVWTSIIGLLLVLSAAGVIFLYNAGVISNVSSSIGFLSIPTIIGSTTTQYTIYGYVCFGVAGLAFLILLCWFSRIRLAVAVCKAAGQFVAHTCFIVFVPILQVILSIGLWATCLVAMVYIVSSATFTASSSSVLPHNLQLQRSQHDQVVHFRVRLAVDQRLRASHGHFRHCQRLLHLVLVAWARGSGSQLPHLQIL